MLSNLWKGQWCTNCTVHIWPKERYFQKRNLWFVYFKLYDPRVILYTYFRIAILPVRFPIAFLDPRHDRKSSNLFHSQFELVASARVSSPWHMPLPCKFDPDGGAYCALIYWILLRDGSVPDHQTDHDKPMTMMTIRRQIPLLQLKVVEVDSPSSHYIYQSMFQCSHPSRIMNYGCSWLKPTEMDLT